MNADSPSLVNRFSEELIAFPKHVSFDGDAVRPNGEPLSSAQVQWLAIVIDSAIRATELNLRDPNIFAFVGPVSPKLHISLRPELNAFASKADGGSVTVSLNLLLALEASSSAVNFIVDSLASDSLEQEEFLRIASAPPKEHLVFEVGSFAKIWRESLAGHATVMPSSGAQDLPPGIRTGLTYLIVGHELGHWKECVYRKEVWDGELSATTEMINQWLRDGDSVVRQPIKNAIREHLSNEEVLSEWTREIHADQSAMLHLRSADVVAWSQSPRMLKHQYLCMGLYFAMLRAFEVFRLLDGSPDMGGHPPAHVRQSLFMYIQGKKFRASELDFCLRQYLVGYLAYGIFEQILGAYAAAERTKG